MFVLSTKNKGRKKIDVICANIELSVLPRKPMMRKTNILSSRIERNTMKKIMGL